MAQPLSRTSGIRSFVGELEVLLDSRKAVADREQGISNRTMSSLTTRIATAWDGIHVIRIIHDGTIPVPEQKAIVLLVSMIGGRDNDRDACLHTRTEQFRWLDRDNLSPMLNAPNWKLSAATDVFGVGMVLHCLVTRDNRPKQPLFLGDGDADASLSLNAYAAQYSQELRSMIERCLAFQPQNRWTFRDLLGHIEVQTDENGFKLADRMRGVNGTRPPINITDRYRSGLRQQDLPPAAV